MAEYVIVRDHCELPVGTHFIVLPGVEAGPDQLVLFKVGGHSVVGKWRPNVAGCGWIIQPNRKICVTPEQAHLVEIVGPVVVADVKIKTFNTLSLFEHERALSLARRLKQ